MSLQIGNCPDLVSISISAHQNVWDFCKSCPSLQILWRGVEGLPPVLPPLTSIKELIVSNCPNLISITDLVRELYSLSLLKIEKCPNFANIRGFASLRCLVMSSCLFIFLPDQLESCEELVISDCPNLRGLRGYWGEFHSLTKLEIENCPNLRSIDGLPSLRQLVVSSCGVENLPLFQESCEELVISNCPNLRDDYWGAFHSLTKLEIENCPNWGSFPRINASLRRLVVSSCGVENLPERLESCEELIISNCPNLRDDYVRELHSLTKLEIKNCPNLTSFASIQGATSLLRLVMSSCSVEVLPIGLQSCTSLEELIISNCPNLISIPDLEDVLHSLTKLEIENCPNLTSFASIQGAASIRRLVISSCGVEVLPSGLESCTSLEELIISNCPNLIQSSQSLTSLKEEIILNCPNLKSIPDFGDVLYSLEDVCITRIPNLKGDSPTRLEFKDCDNLIYFRSLQEATSLQGLVISSCGVQYLPIGLQYCTSLQELKILDCPNLIRIPDLPGHSLTRLEFKDCNNLRYIGSLEEATSLQGLVISSCAVNDLPIGLESCTSLEELEILHCPNVIRIRDIGEDLSSLIKLHVANCPKLKYFGYVGSTSLEELEISDCLDLKGIPELGEDLSSLIKLHVTNCPNLISFGSIQGAAYLHRLTLFRVDPLPIGLESCKYIKYLQICGCPNLISFPDLGVLYLEEFEIRFCPRLTSFLSLQHAKYLKRLVITFCESLEALSNGLQSCTDLEELTIWNCYNLESIPDLRGLLSLTELSIKNCRRCTSVSLPDGLKTLVIGPFSEKLQSFPTLISYAYFQNSLERLELCGWAILNSLPEEIQRFNAVRFLCINKFDGILALPEWLGNLSSLRSLTVVNCENLMDFPTAEAMGRLTELEILDCPALQERCAEETGTEWYKIAHIPIIQIDGEYIRGEGYDI